MAALAYQLAVVTRCGSSGGGRWCTRLLWLRGGCQEVQRLWRGERCMMPHGGGMLCRSRRLHACGRQLEPSAM